MTGLNKLVVGVIAQALILCVANAGDSSGGGHSRELEFKKAASIYLKGLQDSKTYERQKSGITVLASDLKKAIFNPNTIIRVLESQDSFVINEATSVIVKKGRITEKNIPKNAYYLEPHQTIYVGIDWKTDQSKLALKEFLRTMNDVAAEEQTIKIAALHENKLKEHRLRPAQHACAVNTAKITEYKYISKICRIDHWDQIAVYYFDTINFKTIGPELWTLKRPPVHEGQESADVGLARLYGGFDLTYVKDNEELTVTAKIISLTQTTKGRDFEHKTEFNSFLLKLRVPGHKDPFAGSLAVDIDGILE